MGRTRMVGTALLVALLVAVLLSLPGDGEQVAVAVEPRTTTASIMVPAAAFTPTNSNFGYAFDNRELLAVGGFAYFVAPLGFPVPVVDIQKLTLYAFDNGAGTSVAVELYRTEPAGATFRYTGGVFTADSPNDPQVVSSTAISPRRVNTALHGAYLRLYLTLGVKFYGLKVTYTYETAP
jgi:hypothetical protein